MKKTGTIDYVELPSRDLEATKQFFASVFGWNFVDYGPDYASMDNAGLAGGFYSADMAAQSDSGSALVVLYSNELEVTLAKVQAAGGTIVKDIFAFPGGRRFHFLEPAGNELAVWSE